MKSIYSLTSSYLVVLREEAKRKRLADFRATVARIGRLHKEVHNFLLNFHDTNFYSKYQVFGNNWYSYLVTLQKSQSELKGRLNPVF